MTLGGALVALLIPACLEPPIEPAELARAQVQRSEATSTLTIATWNLAWFGDPERGPSDDALQLERVVTILGQLDADLIALQEVASPDAFAEVRTRLPGYGGVLSDHAWPQQLGLLYRSERLRLLEVQSIEGLDDAGRPPLWLRVGQQRGFEPIEVVVLHAKAGTLEADWRARNRLAGGLHDALAGRSDAAGRSIILGDFNDQLGASLVEGFDSPYAALIASWSAPTAVLESSPVDATSVWGAVLDHVLVGKDLGDGAASADALGDRLLWSYPDYAETVSDHFPVVVGMELP